MDNRKRLRNFFRLNALEKDIYTHEIGLENIRRIFYFAIVILPANLIHIIIFGIRFYSSTGIEQQWRSGIILSHIAMFLVLFTLCFPVYFTAYRHNKSNRLSDFLVNILVFSILVIGAIVAIIDQMVTTAITPYLIVCLLAGLIFYIRPALILLYFLIALLILFFGLSINQHNPEVLLSNQVNGITATAIGICLSLLLWQGNLTRHKQKRLIEDQNKKLKLANDEKDKFFSIIGHDLRSSFNNILGFSKILEDDLKKNSIEKLEKHVPLIRVSAERTYKLLENLLDWAKTQTGSISFNPVRLNLADLIQEKVEEFSISANEKKISLKYNKDPEIEIIADIKMLETIIRNLISNAIKFTNTGGNIEISTLKNHSSVDIRITDNGIGIDSTIKDSLFKLSDTIIRHGTNNESGTGLGLIICKEFTEKHGGKISVESQQQRGSSFIISLPGIH